MGSHVVTSEPGKVSSMILKCPLLSLLLVATVPLSSAQTSAKGGESKDSGALTVLQKHTDEITDAARSFGIAPRLLASIIYAEQSLNVKPGEDILDRVFALSGYNSSIGVAQVKVNTAAWIEAQLADPGSPCFLSDTLHHVLSSASRSELARKLSEPATNLKYAAAYVAMIQKLWRPVLDEPAFRLSATGIVATLYSLGLTRSNGSLRLPHPTPRMNRFGEVAQRFFDSFEMPEYLPALLSQ
jgi:hypothetical protein